MIPKIINYCWFGRGPKGVQETRCIESWKKYLSNYEIIEWNENNFNIEDSNLYVKQAYKEKKWAFVSDYVRLYALSAKGGVYLDTDVEILRPIDDLLNNRVFLGFESNDSICTAVIGAEKGNEFIKQFMLMYESIEFVNKENKLNLTTNVELITRFLCGNGLRKNGKEQILNNGVKVYRQRCFSSNDFRNIFGIYHKEAYAYHHFSSSWVDNKKRNSQLYKRIKHYLVGGLRNIFGTSKIIEIKESIKSVRFQKK